MKGQPFVTALFVLAVIFVIVRTALLSVPEMFSRGAAIGSVIYDLAIAYIGAWAFNLLIVILPRLRDRQRVLEAAGPAIERLCALGLRTITELGLMPGEFEDLTDSNQFRLFSLRLQDLSLAEESSLTTFGPDGLRAASWQKWTVHKAVKARDNYQSLIPYFPYFESELIQLVNKAAMSTFVDQGQELAKVPVRTGSLSAVARPLAEFITACRKLRAYYDTQVIMRDCPHYDHIVGEVATPV